MWLKYFSSFLVSLFGTLVTLAGETKQAQKDTNTWREGTNDYICMFLDVVLTFTWQYVIGSSKCSGSRSTGRRYEGSSHDDDLELPIFDLETIAAATDGFSINNKLGEGGFGPVYKVPLNNPYEQSQIFLYLKIRYAYSC